MVLRYWGGKAKIASWVAGQFPAYQNYWEPFAGGAAVLQATRRPSGFEGLSDLNARTINFWQQLRDDFDAVIAAVNQSGAGDVMRLNDGKLPADAYSLFREWYGGSDDSAEDAAYYYLCSLYGFLGVGVSRNANPSPSRAKTRPNIAALYRASQRLQGVDVRLQDAIEVIESMPAQGTLIYADPPYVHSERRSTTSRPNKDGSPYRGYCVEADDDQQRRILGALLDFSDRGGMVVLSGYDNDLYNAVLSGWQIAHKRISHYNTKRDKATTDQPSETLWISPLAKPRQQTLFDFFVA